MTAILGLLFLAGCVVLVVVLTVQGSGNTVRVVQVLTIMLAVPTLAIPLLAWGRHGTITTPPTADQLHQARETLAGTVARQWRHEARARFLADPEPMPVCWALTKPTMMDHPHLITTEELSFTGRSDQIGPLTTQFRRLRRRRLVILGDPGSGKTTLAIQLLLELLTTRHPDEPIPILVSLAGWDPTEQPHLHTWLASKLTENYPALHTAGPAMAQALADALAGQGHLLPILDGFDELPEHHQPQVITALNTSLTDTDQLILTSRTTDYTIAITEAGDVLTSAAVITPEPLTTTQAADYLTYCLPPDPGPSWRELLHRLRTGTAGPLATVLATPLGLWLLRTVYLTPRTDPTPLLTPATSPTTLQTTLFNKLIPAALATRPTSRLDSDIFHPRHHWNPHDVQRWLTYLAQHLQHIGTRDLHWWHLARHTLSPRTVRLARTLTGALTGALAIVLTGALAIGLVNGLVLGLAGGLAGWRAGELAGRCRLIDEPDHANPKVTHRVTLLARKLAGALAIGFVFGLIYGLVLGSAYGSAYGLKYGLTYGLASGLTFGPVSEWAGRHWLTDEPDHANLKMTHRVTLLARKLAGALTGGLVFGLVFGLMYGVTDGLQVGLRVGLANGLAYGLAGGLAGWLTGRHRLTDEPVHANLKVTHRVTLLIRKLAGGLAIGLVFGLVFGLAGGLAVGLISEQEANLISGLIYGLTFGLTGGLAIGLAKWVGIPSRTDRASTPQSTYRATRSLTVWQFSLAGLAFGLAGGLAGWLAFGPSFGLTKGLANGLASVLAGWLPAGLALASSGAWLGYLLAVCRLATSGKLPWRLMAFLDDAYRLGLLRTVGPLYQFRHAEFQDHLIRTADPRAATDQTTLTRQHPRLRDFLI